jgi:hypothetical protein
MLYLIPANLKAIFYVDSRSVLASHVVSMALKANVHDVASSSLTMIISGVVSSNYLNSLHVWTREVDALLYQYIYMYRLIFCHFFRRNKDVVSFVMKLQKEPTACSMV